MLMRRETVRTKIRLDQARTITIGDAAARVIARLRPSPRRYGPER